MNPQLENGAARADNSAGTALPVVMSVVADNGHDETEPFDRDAAWAEARRLAATTTVSLGIIARQTGLNPHTLKARKASEGWPRPEGAPIAVIDRQHGEATRQEVKRLFQETILSIKKISAQTGVSSKTIAEWAKREGWSRPKAAPRWGGGGQHPRALAVRLCRVTGRQVDRLEQRLDDPKTEHDEKDARILGTLAKTLQTLMALERGDGALGKEPEPVESDEDIRAELARRIHNWAKAGERPE